MNHFSAFDQDVIKNGGYQYTTNLRLSSILANQRLTQATLQYQSFDNKNVIDFGCGDGRYTAYLANHTQLKRILGVDLSTEAIEVATKRFKNNNKTSFRKENLERPSTTLTQRYFNIGIARGLIHHFQNPELFFNYSLKNIQEFILLEPNGWNPVLKIIEKTSTYHREHQEKSYTSRTLKQWLTNSGFQVKEEHYIGLVPFFCPDIFTLIFKLLEPIVESIPVIRRFCCAVVLIKAEKKEQ